MSRKGRSSRSNSPFDPCDSHAEPHPDRGRRAGDPRYALWHPAGRELRGLRGEGRPGRPQAHQVGSASRSRAARHLDARSRRHRDAPAGDGGPPASPRHHDVGPRVHRVGGQGDQARRLRLHREAALPRQGHASGAPRPARAPAGAGEPGAQGTGRPAVQAGGGQRGHGRAAAPDRHGRAGAEPRADHRRKRDRQGACRARRSPREPAGRQAVHRGQLRPSPRP